MNLKLRFCFLTNIMVLGSCASLKDEAILVSNRHLASDSVTVSFDSVTTKLSSCKGWFLSLLSSKPHGDVFGISPQTESLREILSDQAQRYAGVTFKEDLLWEILVESFDEDSFKALLEVRDSRGVLQAISPDQLGDRLKNLNAGTKTRIYDTYGYLGRLQSLYREVFEKAQREKRDPRAIWNEQYHKHKNLDSTQRARLHEQIEGRFKEAKLEKALSHPMLFELKLHGGFVEFPNGVKLKLIEQKSPQEIVVALPYEWIMRTQDYFNPSISARHRADPKLKNIRFDGIAMPDGRMMIMDQHHRVAAYYAEYGDPLPFRIKSDGEGVFRSQSFLYPMKFYAHWSSVTKSEREELLRVVEDIEGDPSKDEKQKALQILKLSEELYLKTLKLRDTKSF